MVFANTKLKSRLVVVSPITMHTWSNKEVDGKQVQASKEDPRIVLNSNVQSGKICVHKAGAVYFG